LLQLGEHRARRLRGLLVTVEVNVLLDEAPLAQLDDRRDDLAQLHGDTLEQAQIGNPLGKVFTLTETGERVNGSGDKPNRHDVLTGSHSDGRAYAAADGDHTCHNWTSDGDGAAQLGHADKQGGGNASWNSAHISKGCSQAALVSTGGEGKLYCFAVRG